MGVTKGERAMFSDDWSLVFQGLRKTHGKPMGRKLVKSQPRDSPDSLASHRPVTASTDAFC